MRSKGLRKAWRLQPGHEYLGQNAGRKLGSRYRTLEPRPSLYTKVRPVAGGEIIFAGNAGEQRNQQWTSKPLFFQQIAR